MINTEEVLNVVKILRGNNDTIDNCTHVSSDLMEYFNTGMIPNKKSSTKASTLEDFDVNSEKNSRDREEVNLTLETDDLNSLISIMNHTQSSMNFTVSQLICRIDSNSTRLSIT